MRPRYLTLNKKIDFFPGAHGNFLEMLLNLYAYNGGVDPSRPLFNENGACHVKYDTSVQDQYEQKIGCHHYTVMDLGFNDDDRVVEISIDPEHKITVLVNSHLRAGDQVVDIINPEINTLEKFKNLPKSKPWIDWLTKEYGEQKNYPRSAFRKLCFNQFHEEFNRFSYKGPKISFPHSAFFDLDALIYNCERIAKFFDLPFVPDTELPRIWEQFMKGNQGLRAKIRCEMILDELYDGSKPDLKGLSVVEEAWLIHNLCPEWTDAHVYLDDFPAILELELTRG